MPGRVLGSLLSTVLSVWHTNPTFHDEKGDPACLPITGSTQSFEDLVHAASGRSDYESALEHFEQIGCVRITEEHMVELEWREYVIRNDMALVLASGLGTLANTISKNWNRVSDARAAGRSTTGISNDPDRLEQKVAYVQSIDASTLMSVRRLCNERINRFALEIDEFLTPMQVLPQHAEDGVEVTKTHRIGVGAYYFEVEAPE